MPAFKWPKAPSAEAEIHELADFVELTSWGEGNISVVELSQLLGRSDEADYSRGVPEEDEADVWVDSAFAEVERRRDACSGAYPFVLDHGGQSVRCEPRDDDRHAIYMFLLLATRLNMKEDRQHGGIDGTKIFEELGAEAARSYLGPRAESLVFGTSADADGFASKVNDLCERIGEGDGFDNHFGGGEQTKDDGLDVVAWTPFSDEQQSKVIIFGQCKTGTNFRHHLTELQPSAFCSSWLRSQPVLMPTRTFFVAEALPRTAWGRIASKGGLLFDRCRIVDFSEAVRANVVEKIRTWTNDAAATVDLPSLDAINKASAKV